METIKLTNANQVEIAAEIAGIVKNSLAVSGKVATFDVDDAAEIESLALSASKYWTSVRKPAKAKAAESIRSQVALIRISASYALTFGNTAQ